MLYGYALYANLPNKHIRSFFSFCIVGFEHALLDKLENLSQSK